MALVRTNYPMLSSLLDDFFGTDLADWRSQNYSPTNTTLPKVNIKEDEIGFVVEMAAPGMKKGDFNIQLDQNLLTISSEKQYEKEENEGNWMRREYGYASFQRMFQLPENANPDEIDASMKNGVLKIKVGKVKGQETSKKAIEIK